MKNSTILSIIFLCLSFSAVAASINPSADKKLQRFIGGMEIVSEVREPFLVRIIRVTEKGECGSPSKKSTCPKVRLLIFASTIDEYSADMLYELPVAYGWEFVEWKSKSPREEDKDAYTTFTIQRSDLNGNLSKENTGSDISPWTTHTLEIGVNPWRAYAKTIK
jgi:hypothetical protein